ncbi:MAG: S-methyl-5-thioribose-1-phosphate isomerase [Lentisphaerae bacterium]|nr:S-methyl-5-thioribose-1-phosphate isomerase [Lentisphaerota bacterium]
MSSLEDADGAPPCGRPLWADPSRPGRILVLDQRALPHRRTEIALTSAADAANAIRDMTVRGAPLIGATAAWGMALAARHAPPGTSASAVEEAARILGATRPTAQDLHAAIARMMSIARAESDDEARAAALAAAAEKMCADSIEACRRIGEHGLPMIAAAHARNPDRPVNVLTHCNAGWLACLAHGTATAPIYRAHALGIPIHVWVDETRPRNQGAALTAWELGQAGVPHTLVADNAGGHLMQHGRVDLVLVGADRITRRGDAANKIGTYLKALAAHDNAVPFHVAAPATTFDPSIGDGVREIPIEERDPDEVRFVSGSCEGRVQSVRICPATTIAANPAFDVTPARLISGIITERGLARADEASLRAMFPEWEASAP